MQQKQSGRKLVRKNDGPQEVEQYGKMKEH